MPGGGQSGVRRPGEQQFPLDEPDRTHAAFLHAAPLPLRQNPPRIHHFSVSAGFGWADNSTRSQTIECLMDPDPEWRDSPAVDVANFALTVLALSATFLWVTVLPSIGVLWLAGWLR